MWPNMANVESYFVGSVGAVLQLWISKQLWLAKLLVARSGMLAGHTEVALLSM